jgi:hypothetical protein
MKNPKPLPTDPKDGLELELGRRRAMQHARDAARLLVDVLDLVPRKDLAAYTEIVDTLNTLKQRLIDLAPPKS